MGIFVNKYNYLIDRTDISFNLDRWGKKGNNILFITGESGSGKSTLAREIAQKTGALCAELDNYIWSYGQIKTNFLSEDDKEIIYYLEDKFDNYNYLNKPSNQYIGEYRIKIINAVIEYGESLYPERKIIVEGAQLFDPYYFKPEYYSDKCLIIKGTSSLSSSIRAFNRDKEFYKNNIKSNGGQPIKYIQFIFEYINHRKLSTHNMNKFLSNLYTK